MWHVTINQFVGFRVTRWRNTYEGSNFIRSKDFVTSELISNLRKLANRHKLEWISEEGDLLIVLRTLRPKERSLHSFNNGIDNRFNGTIEVIKHGLLIGSAIHHFFSKAELIIQ